MHNDNSSSFWTAVAAVIGVVITGVVTAVSKLLQAFKTLDHHQVLLNGDETRIGLIAKIETLSTRSVDVEHRLETVMRDSRMLSSQLTDFESQQESMKDESHKMALAIVRLEGDIKNLSSRIEDMDARQTAFLTRIETKLDAL